MTRDWKVVGDDALKAGDNIAAEQAYTNAIATAEANADLNRYQLYAARSAAHHNAKNFSKSLEDAERAIFLKPSFGIGHLRVGHALEGLQRLEKAYESYKTGLVHDPTNKYLIQARDAIVKQRDRAMKHQQPFLEGGELTANYQIFLEWLQEGNAYFPKITLREYTNEHRGVHALSDIIADELLTSIPRSLIITTEIAIQSAIGKSIIRSGVEIRSRHSLLAAFLLQERARPLSDPSFWAPYLNVLPEKFENIPLNFSREELAYLKGSMVIDKIDSRVETLKSEYQRLIENVPEFKQFTYDDFAWARSIVITRIFGICVDGRKTEALVPFADFLNHRRPRETVWVYEPLTSAFTITAIGCINAGAQISDSYGRKCNSRFFTNYGFSLAENDDNEALIRIPVNQEDPALDRKAILLGDEEFEFERSFSVPANVNCGAAFDEMMSYLRLSSASNSELDTFYGLSVPNLKRVLPMNHRNETASLQLLKMACKRSLSLFDTTIEEDDELLTSPSLTSNIRNCILMRLGEKRVLSYFITFVDDMIPLLSFSQSDIEWVLRSCIKRNFCGAFDVYVKSVVEPLIRVRQNNRSVALP
uniref:SET domain-containing protein n=2 Tax=Spongospora subterranea TaxID=70186 RepID=A0A0H5R613_9EUKA|eukprot:CRZ09568.1 hypothetical protein [Spongospora subterranea]